MQTFLPYADFIESAKVLDRARLGKQRVEAMQIYNALSGKSTGWVNHPATKMWKRNTDALLYYLMCMTDEWIARGYENNITFHYHELFDNEIVKVVGGSLVYTMEYPWWFGQNRLHDSHKSNLLRKMPEHYSKFGWEVGPNIPYWWPNN